MHNFRSTIILLKENYLILYTKVSYNVVERKVILDKSKARRDQRHTRNFQMRTNTILSFSLINVGEKLFNIFHLPQTSPYTSDVYVKTCLTSQTYQENSFFLFLARDRNERM